MSTDWRSSPIRDLDLPLTLDGTEYLVIEQLIDPSRPWLGTHDVKLPLSVLGVPS